jgi:long-chain acyl-CoA synthetase
MESSTATAGTAPAFEAASMAEAFRRTVAAHPDAVAFRRHDDSVRLTWSEARERVDHLAAGLAGLGLGHGHTIAILLSNRPEFHLVDLAAITLGATPFSIYNTYSPEQIQYVISDADAKILLVEESLLPNVLEARPDLPNLEHIVVLDAETPPDGCMSFTDLEQAGADSDFDVDAALANVKGDDVLTLIYTSGTTGPPKGVQLSHQNLLSVTASVQELIKLDPGARVISWLPAAHIAERNAHHYIPIVFAAEVTTCDDPRNIVKFLPEVRPNWFFAVPRIWEKLKAGLELMMSGQPEEQQRPIRDALEASLKKLRLEQAGEPVPEDLAAVVQKADDEMFSGLRKMLGLDDVVTVNVGAAPTPVEVLEFFHAIGIELAELWGMSETCGAGTVNPPGKVKIGTVGPAAPGIEIKLAEDGEVMVRGHCVMLGYRNMPDKTKETMQGDWLLTGDIGELDDDGYLKIVDRKKELIINAAGKNMSPAHIESIVKSAGPMIGQAAVIGDARSYNTALIVLDGEYVKQWAGQQGIEKDSIDALAVDDRVRAAVQAEVDAANKRLARVEQIKKFEILHSEWEPGGDELTPTMKLRRKPIAKKYTDEIEGMYAK